jgi:hypothetical protein
LAARDRPPPHACPLFDGPACTSELELEHDVVSAKGFAASELLDLVTGRYAVPIRWVDPCRTESECRRIIECEEDGPGPSVADTKTILDVELTETGEPAIIPTPGPGQGACVMEMRVPARLSLRSEDGAVDAELPVGIRSECGNEAAVNLNGPASMLGGSLASELPEAATVELTFGVSWRQEAWLGIYFLVGASPSSNGTLLLRNELLSEKVCPTEVPKDDVFLGR